MGRAIDMENRLEKLFRRLKIAEDALAKLIDIVEGMEEKGTKVKPVKKEKKNASKEKADNEGNAESSKQSDTRPSNSKSKS